MRRLALLALLACSCGAHAADYVDTFNRANGDLDGSTSSDTQFTWDEPEGGGLSVVDNHVVGGGSTAFHTGVALAQAAGDDMYVQIDVLSFSGSNPGVHLGANAAFSSGYGFEVTNSATGEWRIYRQSNDATIDSGTQADLLSTPYTLCMERISNVIKVYLDGVQVTGAEVTNSAESSGSGNRYAGLTFFGDGGNPAAFDDFAFGDGGCLTEEPPTITSATPSGTLGTQTTATLGATTDQNSGTFYAVVDTDSLSGITASQVKAGTDASGMAVVDDCNAAISTTSPSCGVTGLTAATGYSYAVVQNNANGDSNVLTGTFTTANETLPTISSVSKIQAGKTFTIGGSDFAGSSNTIKLCPTNDPNGGSCVSQTAGSESTSSITVTAASLPMGSDPGETLHVFVNGGAGYNSPSFQALVADPALCVESVGGSSNFRDRSTGDPVDETDVRTVVLALESAAEVVFEDDLDIESGALACIVDAEFSIDEIDDDFLIVFPAGGGAAQATVVDRND